jgi:hypothetical protein
MTFDTTPGDGPALMRVLHQHHVGQLREATVARHRRRLVTAAGIDPDRLSQRGQRTLAELCAIDELAIDGLVEILFATRTAALMPTERTEPDRQVQTQQGTEVALARGDDRGARRDHR